MYLIGLAIGDEFPGVWAFYGILFGIPVALVVAFSGR